MSQRISRLGFDNLAPRLQDVLRARVERLGYLGEFFQCAGHQPDILASFMEMTEFLKKALPDKLTEVGALTVAVLMGNSYELHQHERLSRKLGFGPAWIADVEKLEPDSPSSLSDDERAVQRLAIAVMSTRGKGSHSELDAVIDAIGPDQAIAVLFLIGRYVTHAFMVNSLGLEPPVSSIFSE